METFNIIVSVVQTLAIVGAVVVAWLIGKRQTNIIQEQAAISRRQTEISEATLNLQYSLSVQVDFDEAEMALVLTNRGQTNVYYSGCRFQNQKATREGPRSVIPPSAAFHIPEDWIELLELHDCAGRGDGRLVPREQCFHGIIFLNDEHGMDFLLGTMVFVDVEEGRWNVRCSSAPPKRKPPVTFASEGIPKVLR